jgi:signal transduction histidine kinase
MPLSLMFLMVFAAGLGTGIAVTAFRRRRFDASNEPEGHALAAVGQAAVDCEDPETLARRVCAKLPAAVEVQWAAWYDVGEGAVLRRRAAAGRSSGQAPAVLTGQRIVEHFDTAKPVAVVCDTNERNAAGLDAELRPHGVAAALPVRGPSGIEAVVLLGLRSAVTPTRSLDGKRLTLLASQLSSAYRSVRLAAELEQSREMVQRADRLSAIGTMAAGLAHEIRNPLVSIRTFTQLLPERIDDEEFRNQFLDLTLSEVDRICALISELLTFARPAPAELHPVDLADCLERICLLLGSQARNRGVELETDLDSEIRVVTADEDQLKQVFMNVILNAIQACGDGDRVMVRLVSADHGTRAFSRVEVADDGCGMDRELRERIFNPFFTTRGEGTGLGLSIAHQMITRNGGTIEVESELGVGSTFQIDIPVDPIATGIDPPDEKQAVSAHG